MCMRRRFYSRLPGLVTIRRRVSNAPLVFQWARCSAWGVVNESAYGAFGVSTPVHALLMIIHLPSFFSSTT